jgi:hypothetical protein
MNLEVERELYENGSLSWEDVACLVAIALDREPILTREELETCLYEIKSTEQ